MSIEPKNKDLQRGRGEAYPPGSGGDASGGPNGRYRDEVYSLRVPAGKRTYFFDVKSTRSGEDFFVTITESKRVDDDRYEKHKIFLYKEDFGKFVAALHTALRHIKDECLPGYDFHDLPELTGFTDDAETYSDDY